MFIFNKEQLDKLNRLRTLGINPYPAYRNSNTLYEITNKIALFAKQSMMDDSHTLIVAGRLRFKNDMGNVGFGRVYIEDYKLQILCSKKELGDAFKNVWKNLDLGDQIWVSGNLMRTRSGEITLRVSEIVLMAKCLNGMPDKIEGVTDPEIMQRQRYLDLMTNQESYSRFKYRSEVVFGLRRHLNELGYMEVETPILQTIPGGANARPFTTHHNALDADLFLRIAPELYLKRLLVGGYPQVFEIGKNFRNEGISTKHNPEFTMVEFYKAHSDVRIIMNQCQSILQKMFDNRPDEFRTLPFNPNNWTEVNYLEAIGKYVSDPWNAENCQEFLINGNHAAFYDKVPTELTKLWDIIFSDFVEPTLIDPTFITDYPVDISPLAKRKESDSRLTDRFELFIMGREIANGFTELNDPIDQAERFAAQVSQKDSGDNEAMYFDHDYINALSYGLVPSSGCGIGIDRLVMLLTNSNNIRDVILFPTMKPKT